MESHEAHPEPFLSILTALIDAQFLAQDAVAGVRMNSQAYYEAQRTRIDAACCLFQQLEVSYTPEDLADARREIETEAEATIAA